MRLTRVFIVVTVGLLATAGALWSADYQALGQEVDQGLAALAGAPGAESATWTQAGSLADQVKAMREALPGGCLWEAFQPVDTLLRAAYRSQRQMFVDKDAGQLSRRDVWYALDTLTDVLHCQHGWLNQRAMGIADLQLAQVRNAANHKEYHAALCALWHFAAETGLWDRQVALTVAEKHLRGLQTKYTKHSPKPKEATQTSKELTALRDLVHAALVWQAREDVYEKPAPEAACLAPAQPEDEWLFRTTLEPVGSYRKWISELNPPLYKERLFFIQRCKLACPQLVSAPACVHCTNPEGPDKGRHVKAGCVLDYRSWQYALKDMTYGWRYNTHSGGGQDPGCDWRQFAPPGAWPGAQGDRASGGL